MTARHPLARLAFVAIACGMLVGCGKAAPMQQHPALVNDSLTRGAALGSTQTIAKDTQEARETEANRAENSRVRQPGPGNDEN